MSAPHTYPIVAEYFEDLSGDPNRPQYSCIVCGKKTFKSYKDHAARKHHKDMVLRYEERQAGMTALNPALSSTASGSGAIEGMDWTSNDNADDAEQLSPDVEHHSPVRSNSISMWDQDDSGLFANPADDETEVESVVEERPDLIWDALYNIGLGPDEDDIDGQDGADNRGPEEQEDEIEYNSDDVEQDDYESDDWYPFKKKENLIGMLLLGTTRHVMSREQYNKIRDILTICHVNLPVWATLQAITLNLANPHVRPHLITIPELATNTPINRLSQSKKWREGFKREYRTPMIETRRGHFYIYEPLQLLSSIEFELFVPVFFYKEGDNYYSKCLKATVVKKIDGQGLDIAIYAEPEFSSTLLFTINVNDFWRPLALIELPGSNHIKLKDICGPFMYQSSPESNGLLPIPIENPWRKKANGRLIRHIPITLYSDDTSGNKSKKYNCHMSFYYTLSGLPTKLSNQDYNIHYAATSNVASALELGEPIVDELTTLATEGFSAYDGEVDAQVLVMVVVLCYLGDSPMHAEICNCINPGITLTPCRICNLRVDTKDEKTTTSYIQQFVGLDENFEHHPLAFRDWKVTQALTSDVWKIGSNLRAKDQITKARRLHGIRDTLNEKLMNKVVQVFDSKSSEDAHALWQALDSKLGSRVYNPFLRLPGFNGHRDTPVEALHVYLLGVTKYPWQELMAELSPLKDSQHSAISARWQSFDAKGLNIPPIIPETLIKYYKSLVGKEYRIIMQAIPFVLFEEIGKEKRDFWSALIHLASFIFQNEISDIDQYLIELQNAVDNLLVCLVGSNARWTNKPKFHMLTHLPHSIKWFGPSCLVATEIFESFNAVLRAASIHSNRQAPGRDIADAFNSYLLILHIISGGTWFDPKLDQRVSAGDKVLELFAKNKRLQHSLGMNTSWNMKKRFCVKVQHNKNPETTPDGLPTFLSGSHENEKWERVTQLILPNDQKVEDGAFLWVKPVNQSSNDIISCVESMWKPMGKEPSACLIAMKKCYRGEIHPFYSMREIVKTDASAFLKPIELKTMLNVQHNCHDAQCRVGSTRFKQVERQDTTIPLPEIIHNQNPSYILNSASLYSAELHRRLSAIHLAEVQPDQWSQAIGNGLKTWREEKKRKQKK
ncbi:hypothetical protein DFH28DRAFT_1197768 [Melampsora americana]|nr:hypothetical protein DFH28DRAFT_1193341 [Melampsora americana]KAH9820364.1 hypothetical protein DFH28DRAFT_1197768 [Melampsora americana]